VGRGLDREHQILQTHRSSRCSWAYKYASRGGAEASCKRALSHGLLRAQEARYET
jgi:hypothetical protein